jgi:hypothetical protein
MDQLAQSLLYPFNFRALNSSTGMTRRLLRSVRDECIIDAKVDGGSVSRYLCLCVPI